LPSVETKQRALAVCAVVVAANVAGWICAWVAFGAKVDLLGVCAVVYVLGLRHGLDADHITAIDNVTRKMVQDDKRPVSVGLFFALGHSAMVIGVTLIVALAAGSLRFIENLQSAGGTLSTLVSGVFLLVLAVANFRTFLCLRERSRRAAGRDAIHAAPRGVFSRLFGPVLGLVTRSWHMLPLGLLFGLGFDTATEVAMFGVAAVQASKGVGLLSVLIFPALFTVAMSLVDTIDGVLMMHAYRWASASPDRRHSYNRAITLIAALAAAAIGAVQMIHLLGQAVALDAWLVASVRFVQVNTNPIGVGLTCLLLSAWLVAVLGRKGAGTGSHITDRS